MVGGGWSAGWSNVIVIKLPETRPPTILQRAVQGGTFYPLTLLPVGVFFSSFPGFFWSSYFILFLISLFILFPPPSTTLSFTLLSSLHWVCARGVIRDMHAEIISSIKNLPLDGEDPRKLLQSWGRLRFPRHVLQWVCKQTWSNQSCQLTLFLQKKKCSFWAPWLSLLFFDYFFTTFTFSNILCDVHIKPKCFLKQMLMELAKVLYVVTVALAVMTGLCMNSSRRSPTWRRQ